MSAKEYERKRIRWAKRKMVIKQLVADGASLAEVARRYRITRARVHQLVKEQQP